jgi:hypothetical protein
MKYQIRRLTYGEIAYGDGNMVLYLEQIAKKVSSLYGEKFNWRNFQIRDYAINHRVMICERDGEMVGIMLSRLFDSILDPSIKILMQDLLFAERGSRAAKLLMDDFLTFGKSNADHLITMVTPKTNIKRQTLEKLGFKELETLYRLEVDNG